MFPWKRRQPGAAADRRTIAARSRDLDLMEESLADAIYRESALQMRLSKNGFVVIDDYGGLKNCRQAVHDFPESRALKPD
jgi:hypothetical protein